SHRAAPCALDLDQRPGVTRPLLHPFSAGCDQHVLGAENVAADRRRSHAAEDDAVWHAARHWMAEPCHGVRPRYLLGVEQPRDDPSAVRHEPHRLWPGDAGHGAETRRQQAATISRSPRATCSADRGYFSTAAFVSPCRMTSRCTRCRERSYNSPLWRSPTKWLPRGELTSC